MNRCSTPAWLLLFALCQCDSGPSESAADPRAASTATARKLPIGAQDPKTILELLRSSKSDAEQVMLVPGEGIDALERELAAAGIATRKAKDFGKSNQYYIHKLVAPLRRQGSVWVVFDSGNTSLCTDLETYYFSEYRVDYRGTFGNLNVVHAVNEIPAAAEARVDLEPVTRIQGMVTNIEFSPSGDTMFATSKSGTVFWHSMTIGKEGTALQLPTARKDGEGVFTGGESGLVGLAVHPGYPAENEIYLHYCYKHRDGSREAILSEWQAEISDAAIRLTDERVMLRLNQVSDNHNGGQLEFGTDGYLYVAVGDGEEGKWSAGRAPAHTLRGKVLRIDVATRSEGKEYGIPADNPFVGDDTIPPETWAWGFRNPWRMSFAPSGQLLVGDIGEDRNEEVSLVRPGRHYGWPYFEGLETRNDWALDGVEPEPPLFAYGRDQGMSVIVDQVYEGEGLPWLRGKFVFSDYISGRLWALDLPDPLGADEKTRSLELGEVEQLARWPQLLTTYGKDPSGEVYLGAHNGRVFRLSPPREDDTPEDPSADDMPPATLRGIFGIEYPREDREVSPAEIALGAKLFADPVLVHGGKRSCATCHGLDGHGQDGRVWAGRNTPSAFNAHRQIGQFWDYRSETVDELMGHAHLKTGAGLARELAESPEYAAAFAAAYPDDDRPTRNRNVARALGAYVRQLETRSRWDAFLDGADDALTADELRGLNEFVTVGCASCHQYRALGGGMARKLGLFHAWEGPDLGRGAITGEESENHTFKVPTLLNVAATAPYYHDGSIESLDEAVRNMALLQLNRTLTDAQVDAIVTFLGALTGEIAESLR